MGSLTTNAEALGGRGGLQASAAATAAVSGASAQDAAQANGGVQLGLVQAQLAKEAKLPLWNSLLVGAAAPMCASVFSNPLDVVKTRMRKLQLGYRVP